MAISRSLGSTSSVSYTHLHLSGACYPEGHIESPDMVSDILNLKKKVDAGAEHLVSQLFFDNDDFYDFREKARIAGINVPIQAGIMPVLHKSQIERICLLYTSQDKLAQGIAEGIVTYLNGLR